MAKKRRVMFLQLSHLRRTIKKSAIALLFIMVFAFMLLNKANNALIEKTSTTAGEIITPITEILIMFENTNFSMQNTKRVIHPVIKHRLNVKLQRKINAADTIGTWSIVRGDTVLAKFSLHFHRWK